MTRARIGRLSTAVAAASLVALQVFSGFGQAATPDWTIEIERQPPTVTNGEAAGFIITITNNGPSNVAQLFYVDDLQQVADADEIPILVTTSRGTCTTGTDLRCSIGALNDDESVVILVVYDTPSSGNGLTYSGEANTTGVSFKDKGKNSHGDSLRTTVTTGLASNRNFGGKFNLEEDGSVSNSTQLNGQNRQSTQLFALPGGAGASVEDGLPSTAFSCAPTCDGVTFIGEWSRIVVDNGRDQDEAFKVVITIRNAPNNLVLADQDLFHVLDSGAVVIIGDTTTQTPGAAQSAHSERCDSPNAPNADMSPDGCVHASYVGNNLQMVAWVFHNGGMRK